MLGDLLQLDPFGNEQVVAEDGTVSHPAMVQPACQVGVSFPLDPFWNEQNNAIHSIPTGGGS
jgi:hypothetical protein